VKRNNNKEELITVLGAGVTGLATASFLLDEGYNVKVYEKEVAGGMCVSLKEDNYIIDLGPHKIYSQIPGIMDYFRELLGDDCLVIKKSNSLRLLGDYYKFPPQLKQLINPTLIKTGIGVGFSYFLEKLKFRKTVSYEDYLVKGFGRKGYNLLFGGYAEKVWGDPKQLDKELAQKRMPISDILSLVKNILVGVKDNPDVSADYFYYPKYGMQQLIDKLVERIQSKGGEICYEKPVLTDKIISTIPLPDLLNLLNAPQEIKDSAEKLEYGPLTLVYVFFNQDRALKDNWIFFPEKEFIFNRVSEQKSFSRDTVPDGKTVITAEVTALNVDKNDVCDDLFKAGLINKEGVEDVKVLEFKNVYPLYKIGYKKHLDKVLDYLDSKNIISIGRKGLFNYSNMDHCIDMALYASKSIGDTPLWKESRKIFDNYRIVD